LSKDIKVAQTAEEISQIAFGFMASKALFAGLHIGVFSCLEDTSKGIAEIEKITKIPKNRIVTIMTALTCTGLVVRNSCKDKEAVYSNSPAAQAFLVAGAKHDFSDYLRNQIDKQMYPFLGQLNDIIDDSLDANSVYSYQDWMSDPAEARIYSEAQHAGSLGPGCTLARTVDLKNAATLLDIGGGTGAMSIRLLEAYPNLKSTIIDFQNVAELGKKFISEAGLSDRIRYIPGEALTAIWPEQQDVILMSYLLSGIDGEKISGLIEKAFNHLQPGGTCLVHDFIADNDRKGPLLTALWQLQHMAFTPNAISITPNWLEGQMKTVGFIVRSEKVLIPGLTKLITAEKPV
tara:strand:- start:3014 stop:4054 length:1041 start_codon:yes stop_codon:yes gene_type:complete